MMYKKCYTLFGLVSFVFFSILLSNCGSNTSPEDGATLEKQQYDLSLKDKLSVFSALPDTVENPSNLSSDAKVALGKKLYFDKQLSKNGNISCNSCHNLSSFGVDNLSTSPGDGGLNGDRNSPTILNTALHSTQFWDGRAKDLEEQAGLQILNPTEMAIPSEEFLVDKLSKIEEYIAAFKEAYPDEENPVTFTNVKNAIAVFERKLLTPSRFDKYLNGDNSALSAEEKQGLLSFIAVGCIQCHAGVGLGGDVFQKFGVHQNYWELTGSETVDEGRFKQTNDIADKFVFKVPSLRNITKTQPYFHDGSVTDLETAVDIMAKVQLKYSLTEDELKNIMSFLESLTGELPVEYTQPL